MSKLESNTSSQNEPRDPSKLHVFIKTVKDIAATLTAKKIESPVDDGVLADTNNPF